MKGFMDAVAAHIAWYRAHGMMDNEIVVAPMAVRDTQARTELKIPNEVMTFHVRVPPTGNTRDAAWDAYVKQYDDNSEVVSEHRICAPKGLF